MSWSAVGIYTISSDIMIMPFLTIALMYPPLINSFVCLSCFCVYGWKLSIYYRTGFGAFFSSRASFCILYAPGLDLFDCFCMSFGYALLMGRCRFTNFRVVHALAVVILMSFLLGHDSFSYLEEVFFLSASIDGSILITIKTRRPNWIL